MKIKEVSEKYNLSADTLRYYEKLGFIYINDYTYKYFILYIF